MSPVEIEEVVLAVARALDATGTAYFLGGSMASSLQGEPRSTNDLDFVVDLQPQKVKALIEALGPDFDVDDEALLDAARRRSSWNIYFFPSAVKIDLFMRGSAPFDASEFARRRPVELRPGRSVMVKSPEDTVLRKLLWFRAGGELSTTQWRDVVEVLRVGGMNLDRAYLDEWAAALAVTELLTRARADAGL